MAAPAIRSDEHRVPRARHRQACDREQGDERGKDDAHDGEGEALERHRRRCDFRGDAIVEQEDLERFAGEAADGEEPDRIGCEPHAEQARKRRAETRRETPPPSPRCAAGASTRLAAESPAARRPVGPRCGRLFEVDVVEGEDEEHDADGDGRQRDELRCRADHLLLIVVSSSVVLVVVRRDVIYPFGRRA